jgi:hypothetical protein
MPIKHKSHSFVVYPLLVVGTNFLEILLHSIACFAFISLFLHRSVFVFPLSSSYLSGAQSLIKNNVITNFVSTNSPFIVGIDIQGDTSGVDIVENTVELDINAQYNPTDAYVALIIGENADSQGRNKTITISGNTFKHEELIQNVQTGRVLRNTMQKKPPRIGEWHINSRGLTEIQKRNVGGCPLGYS